MEFYTSSEEKRPIRLSEETRRFAYESVYEHKYGKETAAVNDISMNGETDCFEKLSDVEKYDLSVRTLAKKAPLRICRGEKISGAATVGVAIFGTVPATYDGRSFFGGVTHLTADFETVLKIGYGGLREKIYKAKNKCRDKERLPFYNSLENAVDSFEIWHNRYLDALKNKNGYEKNYKNLSRVPKYGASDFYEAVQSLWFSFAFTRLCGNWPGIGRIDVLLGDYLKKDLEEKRITIEEAREVLAHFFIKGCEWITGKPNIDEGGGDANHFQNIVLSGIDADGNDVTNEVTYLVLDIVEELGISDFPITVRVNKNTDEKLLRRVAEVMRHGGGVIAVYNEELVLKSLTEYGYPYGEAVNFANDGCWEVQIPGKTYFMYIFFDALAVLQKKTLNCYENINFESYEDLYERFALDIEKQVEEIFHRYTDGFTNRNAPVNEWKWKKDFPCTVISLFENACIERGLSYLEGGAVYNVISPHIGGLADAANSLRAIKKIVFDEKLVSFKDFMEILRNNWDENEPLRQYALSKITYYGNDDDEADSFVTEILDDFSASCGKFDGKSPIMFPPGVSTFGRQIEWAGDRLASPHGRKRGEVLSGNSSPTPGTDRQSVTAVINSYCKADLKKQVTGAALDVSLLPSSVKGEDGLSALVSLIKGFVTAGGYFMQIDVADTKILEEAQRYPERFPSLSVRVTGWNARFVVLNREWQNMIIERDSRK